MPRKKKLPAAVKKRGRPTKRAPKREQSSVTDLAIEENKKLILGYDEYTRRLIDEMKEESDARNSQSSRRYLMYSAVVGIMIIVLIGWSVNMRNSFQAVSADESGKEEWDNLKSEFSDVINDSKDGISESWSKISDNPDDEKAKKFNDEFMKRFEQELTKKQNEQYSISKEDTLNWNKYNNEKYFLSAMYPNDWFVVEGDGVNIQTSQTAIALNNSAEGEVAGSAMKINFFDNPQKLSLQTWFLEHKDQYADLNIEIVNVGNITGILGKTSLGAEKCSQYYFTAYENYIYTMSLCNSTPELQEKNRAYFSGIIQNMLFGGALETIDDGKNNENTST